MIQTIISHPRARLRACAAFLVALILLAAPQSAPRPAEAQGSADQVVALVNALRASLGLDPWTVHPTLAYVAQAHVNWMVATGQYGHTGEGGSTPQDRALAAGYAGSVAENWVSGGGMSPAGAVEWWRNSGIHYATLTSSAQHVGVGVASSGRGIVYVLVAGRPSPPRRSNSSGSAAEEEDEDEGPLVIPITRAEPDANGRVTHVVQPGQTAWAIAAVYGVDLDEMLHINNLQRPVVLMPDDTIIVKLGPGEAPPPSPTPIAEYAIGEGQTVWEVAVTHGLTVDELLGYNGLTREDVIVPGMVLRLIPPEPGDVPPEEAPAPAEPAVEAPPEEAPPAETAAETPPEPDGAPAEPPPDGAPADAAPPEGAPPTETAPEPDGAPAEPPPVEATPEEVPPTALPTITTLPTAALVMAATFTPTEPPAPSATLPDRAPPVEVEPDDDDHQTVILGLGMLGAVWVLVGGVGLASYVLKRRR